MNIKQKTNINQIRYLSFIVLFLLSTGILNGQIISQYIETNSGTAPKGIEILNNTGIALNFSTNNLVIEKGVNGGTPNEDFTLSSGTLSPGAVIVIGTSDLEATTLSNGGVFYAKSFTFNGDDALVIKYGGVITDVFGTPDSDPGSSWSGGGVSTANQNIALNFGVITGDLDGWTDPSSRFNVINSNPSGTNGDEGFGVHFTAPPTGPTITSTFPINTSSNIGLNENIVITFSEDVTVSGSWFDISGSISGSYIATVSGGPEIFILDPDSDFADGEVITVSILSSNVKDLSNNNMPSDYMFSFTTVSSAVSDWVINEILADPDATNGDSNGDGTVNTSQDEFVELINVSSGNIDISGWTISDGVGLRHTFPPGTIVPSFTPVIVFGGGSPTGLFGGAITQTASTGALGLNNTGDNVTLKNGGIDITSVSYGSEGGGNESLTRDPDITGSEPLVKHSLVSGSGGAIFSPGTKVDGSIFPGGTIPVPFVINELLADPASGLAGDANGDGTREAANDEFVELVNNSGASIDISGWTISDGVSIRHTFPTGSVIPDLCAVVVFGGGTPIGSFSGAIVQTASSGSLGLNNGGDVITLNNSVDDVVTYSYGSEGGDNQSLTRDPDIIGLDPLVKHSSADGSAGLLFSPGSKIDGTPFPGCPQMVEIFEIQGSGLSSPFDGFNVITMNNVVTAITKDGMFIQTPSDRTDNDINTSDGIYVFNVSAPAVSVGDLVNVSGVVDEFFDFTEIVDPVISIIGSAPVPAPIVLNAANPSPVQPQSVIEFEKYEGMLVSISEGIVTGPNQSFNSDPIAEVYIVASATRTFREPGIEFPGINGYPIWDGNSEVFELDPDKMGLTNQTIPVGSSFQAVGVLGYEFSDYEFWPTSLTVDKVGLPVSVRLTNSDEVTIGSLNLFRLFDDLKDDTEPVIPAAQYNLRLKKFSNYILNILNAPMILAVQEAEKIEVLEALADQINNDENSVEYTAYLVEGNDVGGIDVGFLVRTDHVLVNSITQLGADEIFAYDNSLLNDRPPLLLDGSFIVDGEPDFPIQVIAVHNRSLSGIEGTQSERVQLKRKSQAEYIAQEIQSIQDADPNSHIVVTGDFNAFEFTDGYADVVGIISGNFDPSESLRGGEDFVEPDLINQVLNIPANERYSFIFNGTSQVLDHSLTSSSLSSKVSGFEYGRGNADAAEIFLEDDSTPLRSSDHDGLVLFLDVKPPQITLSESENLWPANHKYKTFTVEDMISSITEAGNDLPLEAAFIHKVTSDEPEDENGNGDGNTSDDIVIVDCQTVDLRAERAGNGNGRVYTIFIAAQDQYGNLGIAEYKVGIPHNKKSEAVDDGAIYEVISDCLPQTLAKDQLADSDEIKEVVELPTEYSLSQNYPNPFNPMTKIKFDLKEASNVVLKVYDMLGREIAVLVNGQKTAGSYEVNFDASELTSGIYFYTIQANNFVQTKKMLLMK